MARDLFHYAVRAALEKEKWVITMDKLAKYRQIVQDVLREYAAVPIANGDVQTQTIFDLLETYIKIES
jgi:XisI protein